jgi:hypothetical protein
MDLLIIIKWLSDFKGNEHTAPSIITMMINMGLNFGKIENAPLLGNSEAN